MLSDAFAQLAEWRRESVGSELHERPAGNGGVSCSSCRLITFSRFIRRRAAQPGPTAAGRMTLLRRCSRDAARDLVAKGARLLGGCCGTTPAHIAALARICDPPSSGGLSARRSRYLRVAFAAVSVARWSRSAAQSFSNWPGWLVVGIDPVFPEPAFSSRRYSGRCAATRHAVGRLERDLLSVALRLLQRAPSAGRRAERRRRIFLWALVGVSDRAAGKRRRARRSRFSLAGGSAGNG